ncbi:ABC transporter ATP-binding protein [Termitidicoccus mucosus]|uniref:ABC transporter n=1 Tax=Termitidicoccus mucosus TaxID=1184151 RepID=A0A178IBS3_9BACT|nr:ABC transporter [Opitutaceae bacterium TSB47]
MKKSAVSSRSAVKGTAPILDVSALTVERGKTIILRDIAWRVERGQHWVILGPNGCGKTSLLRALTGYMPPTGGAISVLGRRYGDCDWRDLRLSIGLVTSALQISIPPAETAVETVMSGKFAQLDLWARTTRADRAAALAHLRLLGAGHLAEREWIFLSQGERQRVLIARALMAKPRILILDEPCSGLDPVARDYFLGFVEKLARRRASPSLVLVTHHVEEITPAFTHALLLREGRVVADGPLAKALTARTLSTAFGAPMRLARRDGVWRIAFPRAAGRGRGD